MTTRSAHRVFELQTQITSSCNMPRQEAISYSPMAAERRRSNGNPGGKAGKGWYPKEDAKEVREKACMALKQLSTRSGEILSGFPTMILESGIAHRWRIVRRRPKACTPLEARCTQSLRSCVMIRTMKRRETAYHQRMSIHCRPQARNHRHYHHQQRPTPARQSRRIRT